jgi:hypothetical protein
MVDSDAIDAAYRGVRRARTGLVVSASAVAALVSVVVSVALRVGAVAPETVFIVALVAAAAIAVFWSAAVLRELRRR